MDAHVKLDEEIDTAAKSVELNNCGEQVEKKEEKVVQVGMWEEAPEFSRDNEFIRKGYRIHFNTFKSIIKSLFICHNESMNVWSHLIGVILFICFIAYISIYVTPRFVFPSYQVMRAKLGAYFKTSINNTVTPMLNSYCVPFLLIEPTYKLILKS